MKLASIVHIGVGNFHRSHQAWYLHRLADPDWQICGVGMLPGDARVRDGLGSQDWNYSLLIKDADGSVERQVITSITGYLLAPEDPAAVVDRLADPATRIVSLTITEGGYDLTPAVEADALAGTDPTTVFGVVVAALARRRANGQVPFTVMSCDNVQDNGGVAREAFASFAAFTDPGLAAWIRAEVAFPNSMVDRITPATTAEDLAYVAAEYDVNDPVPVPCERFAQWVLEDRFTDGRPPLDHVGVQLVPDVAPYELMKLRLLNAGHQVIAYYGLLLGHHWVHDAMADASIVELLERFWAEEAVATLAPIPGVDFADYCATLLGRFGNRHVADTLARLASFGSDRIPTFLVPVVRDSATATPLAAAVTAGWLRWAEVADDLVDNRRGTPEELTAELLTGLPPAFLERVADVLGRLRERDPADVLSRVLRESR